MAPRHRLVLGGCILLLIGLTLLVLAVVSVAGGLGAAGTYAGLPFVWGLSGLFLAGARGAFRLARRDRVPASADHLPG